MDKLKPCPFCGGKADLIIVPGYFKQGLSSSGWLVKCLNGCCNQMPYRSDHDAVDAWNKRAENVIPLGLPTCQCCGKPINNLMVNFFDHEGGDSFQKMEFTYAQDSDCVIITVSPAWTGYELDDDERKDTIRCPECGKYPFAKDIEMEIVEPVDVMMWLSDSNDEKVVPENA